jgi:hypothetical protein
VKYEAPTSPRSAMTATVPAASAATFRRGPLTVYGTEVPTAAPATPGRRCTAARTASIATPFALRASALSSGRGENPVSASSARR